MRRHMTWGRVVVDHEAMKKGDRGKPSLLAEHHANY